MIWHLRRGTAALSFAGLSSTALGDAGLVALAPALRRLAVLEGLYLGQNPLGDEGLAALVAPPPPAGVLPPTTGGLAKLEALYLSNTQITDAGCATLAAAFDSCALPPLEDLDLLGTRATGKATRKVEVAITHALTRRPPESRRESASGGLGFGHLTMVS